MNTPASPPMEPTPPQRRTRRRMFLYGGVGLAATAAGLGLGWWARRGDLAVDAAAQAFWASSYSAPDGTPVAMRQFAGKPLLLNFWATWCPPCVEELPLLDRFAQENAANGWQVLGLAADQETPVRNFLQRLPLRFPVVLAGFAGIELSRNLGNAGGGLPFTVVLGAGGEVLHRKIGQVSTRDLQAWTAAT